MLFVGLATAIFAATIALKQNDIKKVLAYSTVSQLGLMFVALGLGAYTSGIFHMATHAFFKALLFLGAGSVIHALAQRAGYPQHGWPEKIFADHARNIPHRCIGDCRYSSFRTVSSRKMKFSRTHSRIIKTACSFGGSLFLLRCSLLSTCSDCTS